MKNNLVVLIIENEKHCSNFIRTAVGEYSKEIITTADAREGLSIFKSKKPNLVYISLNLPGIDSCKVIKIIRRYSDFTTIISLSAKQGPDTGFKAIRSGASDNIAKPLGNIGSFRVLTRENLKKDLNRKKNRLYQLHLEDEAKQREYELELKNRQITEVGKNLKTMVMSLLNGITAEKTQQAESRLLEELAAQLGAGGGCLYEKDDDHMRLVHSIDPGHAAASIPFPLRKGSPIELVLSTGKSLAVENIELHNELSSSGWDGYESPSFIIFPLPDYSGDIRAVISLHNKSGAPFIWEDLELGLIVSLLYKEITRKRRAKSAFRIQQEKYRQLTSTTSSIILSYSLENDSIEFINNAFTEITGYEKESAMNKSFSRVAKLLELEATDSYYSGLRRLADGSSSVNGSNFRITTKSGKHRWLFQKSVVIFNSKGFPATVECIVYDYSEQKKLEKKVAELNRERNILISEINHRVRNNMQLISSLINLQTDIFGDDDSICHLRAAGNRIASMAAVHDSIYSMDFIPEIDLRTYFSNLVMNLKSDTRIAPGIRVAVKTGNLTLDLDRAVLCGLIVNEAVSNSLKFAFEDRNSGIVTIFFIRRSGVNRLRITDDGCGIKSASRQTKGLGLDIIKNLALQLNGKFRTISRDGTTIIVDFPTETVKRKELL